MHAYAEHVLSAAAVRAYAAAVLRGLAAALDYAPTERANAVPAATFLADRRRALAAARVSRLAKDTNIHRVAPA